MFLTALLVVMFATGLKAGTFSPLSLISAYVFFGVVVRYYVVEYLNDIHEENYWNRIVLFIKPEISSGLAEIFICMLIAYITYFVLNNLVNSKSNKENKILKIFRTVSDELSQSKLVFIAVLATLCYLLGISIFQGGLVNAFITLQKRSLTFGTELLYIRLFLVLSSIAISILYYKHIVKNKPSKAESILVYALIVVNLAILFLAGSRGKMLTQLLIITFIGTQFKNKVNLKFAKYLTVGVVGLLIIVFGIVLRVKAQYSISTNEAILVVGENGIKTISDSIPLLDLYLGARYYADNNGYDGGLQFISYPLRLIPRDFWPDKPVIYGLKIREFYYGHTQSGAPPTIFGEFYISFASAGCLICGLFLGIILFGLNRLKKITDLQNEYGVIYIILIIQFIFSGIRAGLEMALFNLLYMLIWLLLALKLCKRNHSQVL
jgi:oligosaccharide repeat unit polymerase